LFNLSTNIFKSRLWRDFFCFYFRNFQHLCKVIYRLLTLFLLQFYTVFLQAQNQELTFLWRIGLTQEFQKFNQFSCARLQVEKNKNLFAVNLGFSPQKATQHIFAPTASIDYARLWIIKRVSVGPVLVFSADSHVFGTRFLYLHSSLGYRFAIGSQWQLHQELTLGPTRESFSYQNQLNKHVTWNYHFKLGVQYAFR
jgi:hypothetical protein